MGGFSYGDEEDSEDDPPEVVGELAAELLADEVPPRFGPGAGAIGHGAFEAAEEVWIVVVCGVLFLDLGLGVVGVDTEAAFFVDVGIAHGYYDGVNGYVHHDDVEN